MFESLNLLKALQNLGIGLGVITFVMVLSGGLSLIANRFFPDAFRGWAFPFRGPVFLEKR